MQMVTDRLRANLGKSQFEPKTKTQQNNFAFLLRGTIIFFYAKTKIKA